MQRKARSKGEKMWARRQIDKTKKRFAKSWLEELEEKAKVPEVAKTSGEWSSTAERNKVDRARRLLEEKDALQKKIQGRFKNEVKRIEDIDKELQGLRPQAAGSSTEQEVKAAQVVAAARHRGEVFEEEVGSSAGCEWAMELHIEELEQRLREHELYKEQLQRDVEEDKEEVVARHEADIEELEDLLEAAETAAADSAAVKSKMEQQQQQLNEAEARWEEQRGNFELEVKTAKGVAAQAQESMQEVTQDCKRSMEEVGNAVQHLQEQHGQELQELEEHIRELQQNVAAEEAKVAEAAKAAEKARVQSRVQAEQLSVGAAQEQGWIVGEVAAVATGAARIKRDRAKGQQNLERAAMELEDMRALCVEQQVFVRVCTVAETQQKK